MKTYWLVKDRIFHSPNVAIEIMGKTAFYEHSIEVVEADSIQPVFKASLLISELLEEITSHQAIQRAMNKNMGLLKDYKTKIKTIQDILKKIDPNQSNEL